MDKGERALLLARYEDGYRAVAEAVNGLSDEELDRKSADGWSARQIVHHLADSEMTSAIRLRRLLAEERPVIQGYDEELFSRRLHYDRPIAASLEALRAARMSSAEIVAAIGEDEWARAGTHSESGAYSVEDWLNIYAAHAHEHAEQIKRAVNG
jgi:hypothetical protein